jgi:hypothetical protein
VKSWPCCGSVGYLRVVEILLLHSRRRARTLALTAAAALIAGCASPALGQAGGARPAPRPVVEAKPLPSAGWRGESIRSPYKARSSQPTTAQTPDGAADASPAQYDDGHSGPGVAGSVLLALVVSLALTGLAFLARAARRRGVARSPNAARAPAGRLLTAPSSGLTAICYARGRNAAELKRHKAVIDGACAQRGRPLASVVRDSHPAKAGARRRSGRAYALEQLANGDASRLVTGRLDHLARSSRRLGALLEWCARHGVDLVAVDVGLDTSTHDGRLAAGRLLAGARSRHAHDARPTAPRRRRADPRNRPRDKWDEPIAARWRRKRPWG